MIRAVLLDIDGVLSWQGKLLPGAAETLLWLQQHNIPCRLLTNRVSLGRWQLAAALQQQGLAAAGVRLEADDILNPALAARVWMQQWQARHGAGGWQILVPEGVRAEFAGFGQADSLALWPVAEQGQGLVLGDLGPDWSCQQLNQCLRWLLANPQAPFLALGLTRYCVTEEGPTLDLGPFVKALEYACGREAIIMGKPSADFFRLAVATMGIQPDEALMVGDDYLTDVMAAAAAGLGALLVRTGKFRPEDENLWPQANIMDSVADLPRYLSDSGVSSVVRESGRLRMDRPVRGQADG
jgi:phospholysine phosphohistidine inorganic pyrophosphate phosphatase